MRRCPAELIVLPGSGPSGLHGLDIEKMSDNYHETSGRTCRRRTIQKPRNTRKLNSGQHRTSGAIPLPSRRYRSATTLKCTGEASHNSAEP